VVASPVAGEAELEFWRSVKDSNKPEELNAYLSTYPNGQFKSLAMARIASIESGAINTATRNVAKGVDPATFTEEGTQVSEDQIGLDKTKRRDIQRRLTGLGFDTKMTGVFDDETRAVMKRWQAARGYPATGFMTKLQHKALLAEIIPASVTASASEDERPARRTQRSNGGGGGGHHRGGGPDAGAAFIGGMMGGILGGAFRR
ncbi:MAG: peptidoglycan-binding domain-containing protein, partial [Bradyrhizobium sp.]|nr:peptidoglycan-binding domain-containing protein [Bradyrhizobium sp.]